MTANFTTSFALSVYSSHLDLLVNYRNVPRDTRSRGNPKRRRRRRTGPGQLAMSGPVIRFALVVTSLLRKLAISSRPSSPPPPPPSSLIVVSNRFSLRGALRSPRSSLARSLAPSRSTDHRTRSALVSIGGKKRCYRSVARSGRMVAVLIRVNCTTVL